MKTSALAILLLIMISTYSYELTKPRMVNESLTQKFVSVITLTNLQKDLQALIHPTPTPVSELPPTKASDSTVSAEVKAPSPLPTVIISTSPYPTKNDPSHSEIDIKTDSKNTSTSRSCYKVTINGETFEECSDGGSLKFNYSD